MARKLFDSHVADATRAGWADLSDALDAASDRTQQLADETRDLVHAWQDEGRKKVRSARKETRWRATAARDALAGRRHRRAPWLMTATALGVGIGASAGYLVRRMWTAGLRRQAGEDGLRVDPAAAMPGGVGTTPTVATSPERILPRPTAVPDHQQSASR